MKKCLKKKKHKCATCAIKPKQFSNSYYEQQINADGLATLSGVKCDVPKNNEAEIMTHGSLLHNAALAASKNKSDWSGYWCFWNFLSFFFFFTLLVQILLRISPSMRCNSYNCHSTYMFCLKIIRSCFWKLGVDPRLHFPYSQCKQYAANVCIILEGQYCFSLQELGPTP